MSESTSQAKCTESEWKAARTAGLFFAEQGTNAFDAAIHKFAEAMRAEGYAQAMQHAQAEKRFELASEKLADSNAPTPIP